MPKFPEPPETARLAAIEPDVYRLAEGTRLWRIYDSNGPHPTRWHTFRHFGPTNSRFDHHLLPRAPQARGILYAAIHAETPFAEGFQDQRVIDRRRNSPQLVAFELRRLVALLDLTGAWPTRAGTAINSGPRSRARRWSARFYDAYPDIDGLWYSSSMDGNRPAVALYERAAPAMPTRPTFHAALADASLTPIVLRAATRFGYGVVG